MIRRLLALLRGPWIADDPHPQPSHLDELDGIRPTGEIPPMTDEQAARLWADLLPTRQLRRVETVYDQDTPLASEVEAWLAAQGGGA